MCGQWSKFSANLSHRCKINTQLGKCLSIVTYSKCSRDEFYFCFLFWSRGNTEEKSDTWIYVLQASICVYQLSWQAFHWGTVQQAVRELVSARKQKSSYVTDSGAGGRRNRKNLLFQSLPEKNSCYAMEWRWTVDIQEQNTSQQTILLQYQLGGQWWLSPEISRPCIMTLNSLAWEISKVKAIWIVHTVTKTFQRQLPIENIRINSITKL